MRAVHSGQPQPGPDAGSRWLELVVRPAMIAAMMVCLAVPLVQIIRLLDPGWRWVYFLPFLYVGCLEAILSERLFQKRRITGWQYVGSRAAELVVLLILLKVVSVFPFGLVQLSQDLLGGIAGLAHLFDVLSDSLSAGLFVVLWLLSLMVARPVLDLSADEGRPAPPPDKTSTEYYLWLTQPHSARDRDKTLTQLSELFVMGGMAILAASALLVGLYPTSTAPALPILLYFALGLALLSQARFGLARAGWQARNIAVQPTIARRWLGWVGLFLVAIAALALLLPTGYAIGPLRSILYALNFLVQVVVFIFSLLIFLFSLPFALLFHTKPREAPSFPQATPAPAPSANPLHVPPWLITLGSAFFWLVVAVLIGYAFYRFLRDREELWAGVSRLRWTSLAGWLRAFWERWRNWQHGVQVELSRRLGRSAGSMPSPLRASRFFSLRRLSPRDLVRYFYLSVARRAAQAGRPRRPGQTPFEYRADLDEQFPDIEPDLSRLTEAFVQARYAQRPVEAEEAQGIKRLWERIKVALRRKRPSTP